jgi:hypothetical protein
MQAPTSHVEPVLTQEDVDQLIKSLNDDPQSVDNLTEAELEAVERRMYPYGSTIDGDQKYTVLSVTCMRDEYHKKLLTTALVGFNYQLCNEWVADLDDLEDPPAKEDYTKKVHNKDRDNEDLTRGIWEQYINKKKSEWKDAGVEPSEEMLVQLQADATAEVDRLTADLEVFDQVAFATEQDARLAAQSAKERKIIRRWLDAFFKFDPTGENTSTRSHSPERRAADPDRASIDPNEFTQETPENLHSSFRHFFDINFEKLRAATEYLYEEKPDMEFAVNVFNTFDTLAECEDYVEKNKTKVITNVFTVTNNKWNFIGPFKENRDRVNFYNKNTQILENMLKKREEDAKLGKDLLKNRIRKKKIKSVKQYGKDHPSFLKYKKQVALGVYDADIEDIKETPEGLEVSHVVEITSTGSRIDEDGIPEDAVEIGVTSINLKTNSVEQSKVYTKAEAPQELVQ